MMPATVTSIPSFRGVAQKAASEADAMGAGGKAAAGTSVALESPANRMILAMLLVIENPL